MLIRMLKFINKYNLLFNKQHGFCASDSTTTAIVNFYYNIIKNIYNGSYTAARPAIPIGTHVNLPSWGPYTVCHGYANGQPTKI